ncbi:phosphate signaling complex protein PhoU [Haloarculaceae archaeon H-GB2-1]|nr:phosphate signaling complex protein PhoU [Haloarculaceae archaeon H-GB1-1]MEA5386352.1 phosphate signaling complex protein PhoU [Haloarculaceae archaeon H-GB11]MEA5407855.1 phosphate signaling complex protein PhoU [Haloarculaceae archaeon H-GB2-1]
MPRKSFQREMDELQTNVRTFGDAVTVRLRRAVTAIERRDKDLAQTVVEGDGAINDRYVELERKCIDLFALQQPVASDLRIVAATYKILTDLERIADLAGNLASAVVDAETIVAASIDIVELGNLAIEMVEDALHAYVYEDTALCFDVAERDDRLDDLSEDAAAGLIRELSEMRATTAEPDALLGDVRRLLLTIRDLERVGDHAVNVAARTLYLTESDDELLY